MVMDTLWKNIVSLVGYCTLNLIHGLYNFYLLAYTVYCYFLRRTQFFIYEIISSEEKNSVSKVDFLNKIPKHLAVIIGSESVLYSDLVKLIFWCMQLGIKFTTFYHHSNGK